MIHLEVIAINREVFPILYEYELSFRPKYSHLCCDPDSLLSINELVVKQGKQTSNGNCQVPFKATLIPD